MLFIANIIIGAAGGIIFTLSVDILDHFTSFPTVIVLTIFNFFSQYSETLPPSQKWDSGVFYFHLVGGKFVGLESNRVETGGFRAYFFFMCRRGQLFGPL